MKKLFLISSLYLISLVTIAQRNLSYEVKLGETVEDVAKKYRVSPKDILKLNPNASNGVDKGFLLIIPDSTVNHYSTQAPSSFQYHLVKTQETLFGLTQKYNITIDDLKRYNQTLYTRGLQVGDEITIPIFSKPISIVEKGKPGLKKYVVKPKEGLWRIAQNHNISQGVLEKLNPGINENLMEGQEIWVPSNYEPNRPTREGMVLYRAEKGEGFYGLQRKFNLTEEELIALNPELKNGIKSDSQIWIPMERFNQHKQGMLSSLDNKFVFEDSNSQLRELSRPSNVHHIAYILPFRVTNTSTDFSSLKNKLSSDKLTQITSDFYLGAKWALNDLAQKGYKMKVQVFDSNASVKGVEKVLLDTEVHNAQVIIGPFLPNVFNALSTSVTNPSVALLAPVSNSNDLELRSNVYQTIPNLDYQKDAVVHFINHTLTNTNLIIVTDSKEDQTLEKLSRELPKATLVNNIKGNSLNNLMSASKNNVVVINSNDLMFVSNLLQQLSVLSRGKFNIRLFALDKGTVFDNPNISNNQLSALHFTYPSVNRFSDGSDDFSKKFLEKYDVLPNKYVVRGYDMTMDAVLRLGVNSDFKMANQQLQETSHLENKFVYTPDPARGQGFVNKGIYILEYNDLGINEIPMQKAVSEDIISE